MTNLKPLKKFAEEKLPRNSTLRSVLLSEPDNVTTLEFLVKLDTWLKLFNLEK